MPGVEKRADSYNHCIGSLATHVSKATSISAVVPALRTRTCSPIAPAAACTSFI